MSGAGTVAGTRFQGQVIAYAYVHILSQSSLRWGGGADDIPSSIAAETGGPGDDLRIGFTSQPPIEVQAKHGLKAGATLVAAVKEIADRTRSGDLTRVFLAVDGGCSQQYVGMFPRIWTVSEQVEPMVSEPGAP